MYKQKKKQRGITLISLVISIIVMLILAGVALSAVIGDNGIISQTQYATFLNEMAAVEEAVAMWKMTQKATAIPANGLCQESTLSIASNKNAERLHGEVGYYRLWSTSQTMPTVSVLADSTTFNNACGAEVVYYPAGAQDLYYLDNDALGIDSKKEYIIDAVNSMVYSTTGITIKGVRVYSTAMAKAVMDGTLEAPLFAEAEVSGTGTGDKLAGNEEHEYGFQIIADSGSSNVYKLYNNGDLYAKGVKGIGLQTSEEDMAKIDTTVFSELNIPSEIGSVSKIIAGNSQTIYVIDNNGYLWAWGNNDDNKLGLTQDQQIEYTGRDVVKLNIPEVGTSGIGVYNVFDLGKSVFVVTTNNKLYAAGYNTRANLGIGNYNLITEFTEVNGIDNPKEIFSVGGGYTDGTLIWYNDAPDEVEERTEEWCSYNKFYWTGQARWGFGGINNNVAPNYTTFSRIWDGTDGDDIDHLIKYTSLGASPRTILLDGTYMQSGFGGSGVSAGADGGGTNTKFFTRTEAVGQTFEKMWREGSTSVLLDSNGELWGVSSDNVSILGETTRDWTLSKLENVPFNTSNLKEVQVTRNNVFYLLNDGTVYATGSYTYMGLGSDWTTNISGFVCLTEGEYAKSFPKVKTLEDGESNIGYLNKNNASANNIFIGEDNKLYMCGNSTLMFRNNILEQNWVRVAKNVKYFDPKSPAYIDMDGNLYVAGENSNRLGLGYETNQKVSKFTEITDSKIKGKAKKVRYDDNVLAVLTDDNILYATGFYENNSNYYYPGWTSTTENQTSFIEVMSEVSDFQYHSRSRLIKKTDDTIWGYGLWRGWRADADANIPVQVQSVTSTIKGLYPMSRHSYILDTDGNLYASGDNGYNEGDYSGMPANTGDYKVWTGNINGEKVKDIVSAGGTNHIILTENGNLYGWGNLNRLGIGSASTDVTKEIQKLPITNVNQIVAGSGFYIAVKEDGTVWGTGSNQNGILGRWIGIDRNSPNSRYKTAFDWVECPELEI